jgi:hypothetical protein
MLRSQHAKREVQHAKRHYARLNVTSRKQRVIRASGHAVAPSFGVAATALRVDAQMFVSNVRLLRSYHLRLVRKSFCWKIVRERPLKDMEMWTYFIFVLAI